jgi:xanthine/uracil/vitamin C permease (AzgA family)
MREKIWDYKNVILMLGNYFQIEQRQTSIRTEIIAGLTTFLTTTYIILALL